MSHALLESWKHTVRRHGPRPAVIDAATGRVTTFRELEELAQAWLAAHAASVARLQGRAVVFALPNGADWLGLFTALLHAGAVAVPLDAGEPAAAQAAVAAAIRAGFQWDGTRLCPLEPGRRYRERTLCLIKLTSGSTGRPRPLCFTAAQMLADGRQVAQTMGLTRRDLNYAIIPLGHSYGLGNLTIPLLAQGVSLVVGSASLPHVIAGDFVRWRPTVLPGVPPIFRGLTLAQIEPASLASLRLAISAGAPLPPEVARAFAARFGKRIHGFYGSSETGGISYDRTGAATLTGRSVGQAMRGVRLTALPGQRLQVRSPSVFTRGNRRNGRGPGAWTPADRAVLTPRGEVALLGRRGTLVKVAGRRVNLAEIAARLQRLPGVRDVWVGLGPGTEPALGAALATGRSRTDIQTALRTDLAPWKRPRRWLLVNEFPLTARGKTDTAALRRGVFG